MIPAMSQGSEQFLDSKPSPIRETLISDDGTTVLIRYFWPDRERNNKYLPNRTVVWRWSDKKVLVDVDAGSDNDSVTRYFKPRSNPTVLNDRGIWKTPKLKLGVREFSPDGKFYSVYNYGSRYFLCKTDDSSLIKEFSGDLAFSAVDGLVAANETQFIRILNLVNLESLQDLPKPDALVGAGGTVKFVSRDLLFYDASSEIHFFNAEFGQSFFKVKHLEGWHSYDYQQKTFLLWNEKGIHVYEVDTNNLVVTLKFTKAITDVYDSFLDKSGRIVLVVLRNDVEVIDAGAGNVLARFTP